MPRTIASAVVKEVPLVRSTDPVGAAVQRIVEAQAPALPVVNENGKLCGIFGEREFIGAVFPGYLGELKYAGFVDERLEDRLQKRRGCLTEPVSKYMNTEHIDVGPNAADAQVAETFLHHRVLIVPVVDHGRVAGVITRWDFFAALAQAVRSMPDAEDG